MLVDGFTPAQMPIVPSGSTKQDLLAASLLVHILRRGPTKQGAMPRQRKLFTIDTEILQALYEYSHQSGDRLDALYDEALRDLLKKKGQPVTLKEALQQSARSVAANDPGPKARKPKRRSSRNRPKV
jgi:hypothetical protein